MSYTSLYTAPSQSAAEGWVLNARRKTVEEDWEVHKNIICIVINVLNKAVGNGERAKNISRYINMHIA